MAALDPAVPGISGQGVVDRHKDRKQLYDPEYCYITITHNDIKGHHTPFWVRFPRYGKEFEEQFPKMRKGKDNGLFYVPRVASKTTQSFTEVITLPPVRDGEQTTFDKYKENYSPIMESVISLITQKMKWHNDLFVAKEGWDLTHYDPNDPDHPLTVVKGTGKMLLIHSWEMILKKYYSK